MHKKYSIFDKEKIVAFVAIVLLLIVIGIGIGRGMAAKPSWDVCYEMTNKHIDWTYAGRNAE